MEFIYNWKGIKYYFFFSGLLYGGFLHQKMEFVNWEKIQELIKLCIKGKKTRITIATQLNNHLAVKFYERFGFKVVRESNWYHKWYT